MAESTLKRIRRYGKYLFEWIFMEKIRGLDFTMRDTHLPRETGGVLHGYSKTDEAHAKAIFDLLGVDGEKRLLDVGCGKGAFLRVASGYPFGKIEGIEIDPMLVKTAKKNFRILNLEDRICVHCSDALAFERYDAFNVFYFFNPFDKEIMKKVVKKIQDSRRSGKEYYVILHNPICADVMLESGGELVSKLYDAMKSYETHIYECKGRE